MAKSVMASAARVFVSLCFLVGSVFMFLSKQKKSIHGFEFVARSRDWIGLIICASVSLFASLYNILVLAISPNSSLWKSVIFIDVAMCGLVSASLGFGWQTYLLFGEGNRHAVYADWRPVCGLIPNLCRWVLYSLISSSVGFAFSFFLLICCVRVIMRTMSEFNELRSAVNNGIFNAQE